MLTRRALLYRTVLGAAGGVLAACAALPAAAADLSVARAQTASPNGELRIAVASFPNTLDALKETNVLRFGVGETLMCLIPTFELLPWQAQRVVYVDTLTLHIFQRPIDPFHERTTT